MNEHFIKKRLMDVLNRCEKPILWTYLCENALIRTSSDKDKLENILIDMINSGKIKVKIMRIGNTKRTFFYKNPKAYK